MNLAGNETKQLFKTLRTGGSPPTVALWAAATVVDQLRKRQRPSRELIATKKLEPGSSYVIRVPREGEASLAGAVGSDTVRTITPAGDRSITSELLAAATDLIGAVTVSDDQTSDEEAAPSLSRRQRRKVRRAEAPEAEPDEPEQPSGRKLRRAERLASIDQLEVDRQSLSRRRRRKLKRAEARARRRPSRRRVRKARSQHKQAASALEPSRRGRRKLKAAGKEVTHRSAKVEGRSTRRRRRKLRKAERALARLTP